ncbi:MAG: SDR family oxidoreductase [Bacteroidales bacterium]|jgi:short-subunit dehydrogenase|nr:SDR family oxidoreductase [Bacteroidales bacterium]
MNNKFKAKVILITGATSGLGQAIAELLADKGHIVYGTSRTIPTKKDIVAEEKKHVRLLQMDITKVESIRSCMQTLIDNEGKIDILINNAGVGIGGVLELSTKEEINFQINTNLIGTMNVCSEVLPHMRKQRSGKIINMSSIAGVMGIPYQGLYSVSKFGIEGYSEALSLEVHQFNIKIILVEPGDFHTEFTSNRKISQESLCNEDYKDSFVKTLKLVEKEELSGLIPIVIAKKINRIINKKRPKFRYSVASPVQKLSILAKKILPSRWFHAILRWYYKVP